VGRAWKAAGGALDSTWCLTGSKGHSIRWAVLCWLRVVLGGTEQCSAEVDVLVGSEQCSAEVDAEVDCARGQRTVLSRG